MGSGRLFLYLLLPSPPRLALTLPLFFIFSPSFVCCLALVTLSFHEFLPLRLGFYYYSLFFFIFAYGFFYSAAAVNVSVTAVKAARFATLTSSLFSHCLPGPMLIRPTCHYLYPC